MAYGRKTGGKDFKAGKSGNPGGMTKEQAKVRHLTRETLKDLMNTLSSATYEDLQRMLDSPGTTALTMMVVKGILTAIETGDVRQREGILERLVGKVKDEVDVNVKPTVIKRLDGSQVVLGMKTKDEDNDE